MKAENTGFRRELSLFDSTMIVVGSMIGSGIFIVSADIARMVGSAGWLLVVWALTGVITLIGALSYGELASMMPKAGGQYVYLREAYNPLIGFLYGWTLFMVIQTGTIAAVAVAFAKFTSVLIPFFSHSNILFDAGIVKISAAQILAILSIVVLTYINIKGLREGKILQDIFTVVKALALILIILLGLTLGANSDVIARNFADMWTAGKVSVEGGIITGIETLTGFGLVAAIGAAMVGSLFSSDAWNNITFTAGEVKNPAKNIPLSLFYGTLIVTVVYLIANVSYLFVLPLAGDPSSTDPGFLGIQFAPEDRVGVSMATEIFGAGAGVFMAALIMVSTFGCNNGLILAGARVYYAMAKDNMFFKGAGNLNSKGVPAFALVVQGVWAGLLCLSGTYGQLLDYVVFAVLIFYCLTIAGIFILRKKKPDAERSYKAVGYPVIPALYIVLALSISIILLITKPLYTWPGLMIVLLGIPVYYVWRRFLN